MTRGRLFRRAGVVLVTVATLWVALWVYRQGPMSAQRARESWGADYRATWGAWWPRKFGVLRGNAIGDNEQTYYYLLPMPPGELRTFKEDLLRRSRERAWSIDDSDDRHAFDLSGNETRPYWWHPDALADADVVTISSKARTYKFFMSSSSGRIYVYQWDW